MARQATFLLCLLNNVFQFGKATKHWLKSATEQNLLYIVFGKLKNTSAFISTNLLSNNLFSEVVKEGNVWLGKQIPSSQHKVLSRENPDTTGDNFSKVILFEN